MHIDVDEGHAAGVVDFQLVELYRTFPHVSR